MRDARPRSSWPGSSGRSAASSYFSVFSQPSAGHGYIDVLPPAPPLPWSWLTGAELDYYAAEFGRAAFASGLNLVQLEQPAAGTDQLLRFLAEC